MLRDSTRIRRISSVLCLCLIAAFVGSCRSMDDTQGKGKLRVGIVFDLGGKDDRSFNSMAWQGIERAQKELDIVVRDAEPGDPASIEPAMRAFAERGYDLIIGVGFAQAPLINDVSKDYPNLRFVIVDSVVDNPNVASLVFKEHEGSFLVGMIGAGMSKTGTVGFVGGMDIPLIHRFHTGYVEGAKHYNPNITVLENYVGVTDSAWNDPTRAKELAQAQYDKKADVIFQAAGNSGMGVFDAAKEREKYAIGTDANQNWILPGRIVTSMLKRVDVAVYDTVKAATEGKFTPGVTVYGLHNDGVGYAFDENNKPVLPPELVQKVEEARAKIISGEIKVTDAMEAKPEK